MMKIFDFNIHPDLKYTNDLKNKINNELNASPKEIEISLLKFLSIYQNKSNIIGFNFMIFTSYFEERPNDIRNFYKQINLKLSSTKLKVSFTHLVNPEIINPKSYLESLSSAGVKFIKFHSYHQGIDTSKYKKCIEISKYAQELNMGICIDASFGSKYLYRNNNLELASEILLQIEAAPVVILHMGGLRAVEAALLIADTKNAYMELSFSPYFYKKLNAYNLLIDAIKIIGPDRLIHASDYPYIDLEKSIEVTKRLIKRSDIKKEKIENIF